MVSTCPVTIRPATTADAQSIATLGAHVFSKTFGHSVLPHQLQAYLDEAYSVSATENDILDQAKSMFVATDPSNKILGFVLLNRDSSEPCLSHLTNFIEFQRFYVDLDLHGSGIGKLLALKAEEVARQEKFKWMWLGVWEENFKAQKVYEKMGYRKVGDHSFNFGGDIQTDWIMVKEL